MDKTAVKFNEELVELIRAHFPGALAGDIEQNAKCAAAIAVAMGGMVAFSYRLNGAVAGRSTFHAICQSIIENAGAIDAKAGDMIREALPKHLH